MTPVAKPSIDAEPARSAASPSRDGTPGAAPVARPGRRLAALHRPFASIPRETWDTLARRDERATPFALWPFHRAWWDAYGAHAHDETVIVVDPAAAHGRPGSEEQPVGIVPLMHRHEVEPDDAATATHLRHGSEEPLTPVSPRAKGIFFGASYHADYATILAARDDLTDVAEALVEHVAALPDLSGDHPDPWDVVDLRRLRWGDPAADALAAAFLRREASEGWTTNIEREDVCPVAAIPPGVDLEGYLATLGKKERHEIRRKLRRAEAAGPIALRQAEQPLDELDEFIELHQKRWGADGLFPPTAGGDASRLFFRRLFELFGPDGPVRLSFLSVGERRIAAGVHLDGPDRAFYYNAGVDPEARDLSPGVVMVAAYLEHAIAEGKQAFDFLRGNEPYKYEWGAVDEPIQRILVRRGGA